MLFRYFRFGRHNCSSFEVHLSNDTLLYNVNLCIMRHHVIDSRRVLAVQLLQKCNITRLSNTLLGSVFALSHSNILSQNWVFSNARYRVLLGNQIFIEQTPKGDPQSPSMAEHFCGPCQSRMQVAALPRVFFHWYSSLTMHSHPWFPPKPTKIQWRLVAKQISAADYIWDKPEHLRKWLKRNCKTSKEWFAQVSIQAIYLAAILCFSKFPPSIAIIYLQASPSSIYFGW